MLVSEKTLHLSMEYLKLSLCNFATVKFDIQLISSIYTAYRFNEFDKTFLKLNQLIQIFKTSKHNSDPQISKQDIINH